MNSNMAPDRWWLYFRRDLDYRGIKRMSERQWRLALALVSRTSPRAAAELVVEL